MIVLHSSCAEVVKHGNLARGTRADPSTPYSNHMTRLPYEMPIPPKISSFPSLTTRLPTIVMAEPLSTAASVIGVIAPALHGIRLLLDDIQKMKDAPETIQALQDHLYRVSLAISSLQGVEPEEWESLGSSVADLAKSTIQFCATTCERFRADLKCWTRHSHSGSFSKRDRATVGFTKRGEIMSIERQLQNCQVTINLVASIATL